MNFTVLGAGAWGTAIALHLERCGQGVTLVPRRMEQALAMASERENRDYLPGVELPLNIQIAGEIGPALMEADCLLVATPVKGLRALCGRIREALPGALRLRTILSLAKGMEPGSLHSATGIFADEGLDRFALGTFSGPTRALEVAQARPTAMVLASQLPEAEAVALQSALSHSSLRVYRSSDVVGVETAGILKNAYAIGSGIAEGLALGDNARAAYLTRALAEMVSLGTHLGGQLASFYGLAGIGDLVATCSGAWSRNRSFGEAIGRGQRPDAILAGSREVVEGYPTVQALHELCSNKGLEAPLLAALHAVLYGGQQPELALTGLMTRELKAEC